MPQLKILNVATKAHQHGQINKHERKQTKKSNGQPTTVPTALSSNFFLPTTTAGTTAAEALGLGVAGGVCEFSVPSWHSISQGQPPQGPTQ